MNECDVKENFVTSNVEDHVEDLWKPIKGDLLSAADKICGLTKELLRYQVSWWWKKDVDQTIK